jgi:predicted GNAT family acetyltransferase
MGTRGFTPNSARCGKECALAIASGRVLTTFPDADAFLRVVGPALEPDEAEHHLLLGLAASLRASPPSPADAPFLAAVDDGAGLALAALMNPARPLVLASDRDDIESALEPLWNALAVDGLTPRQVHAMTTHAKSFVHAWERRTGCATRLRMRQRLHVLTDVRDLPVPSGILRTAQPSDLQLVSDWMLAFDREAVGEASAEEARVTAERRVRAGEVYLWLDGEPRAMAARTRPTAHGIAINAVYTPLEWRGRGYATGCVAALSARMLDEGRDFCVLYTDLANATSNAIYARIGYRGIRDFELYDL